MKKNIAIDWKKAKYRDPHGSHDHDVVIDDILIKIPWESGLSLTHTIIYGSLSYDPTEESYPTYLGRYTYELSPLEQIILGIKIVEDYEEKKE